MLTKRIIPCLDVKNGRTVKGVHFENLRDAGDAVALAQFYSDNGADELVFLDISATNEGRKTMVDFAEKVARSISIPFTIGGGISTIADMKALFQVGADKVSINSSAVKNPELISRAAEQFGGQAIVLAIDAKRKNDGRWEVVTHGGQQRTGRDVCEWITKAQDLGAGEILLTSIESDGVKNGFDLALLAEVKNIAKVPVIASGGAGNPSHFLDIFKEDLADAGLAASVFHFNEIEIKDLKKYLAANGVSMRI